GARPRGHRSAGPARSGDAVQPEGIHPCAQSGPEPGTRNAQPRHGKPAVRQDPVLLPGETVSAAPRANAPRRGKPGVLLYEPLRGTTDPRISDAGPHESRNAGNAGTRLPGSRSAAAPHLSPACVQLLIDRSR